MFKDFLETKTGKAVSLLVLVIILGAMIHLGVNAADSIGFNDWRPQI